MKLIIAAALLFSTAAFAHGGSVYVHGYETSAGTYVAPHMRSAPDASVNNNWSTQGNSNPYTGEAGTKAPSAYEAPSAPAAPSAVTFH